MAKSTKKLLSLLMAMIMVLSLIPAVYAEGETEEPTFTPSVSETYEADVWIEVSTAADWDAAFKIDSGVNTSEYTGDQVIGVKLMNDLTLSPNEQNSALWRIGADSTKNVLLDLGGYTLAVKSTGDTCRMIRLFEIANGSDLTVIDGTVEIGAGLLSNGGFARTTSAESDLVLDGVDVQFTITSTGVSAKYGMFAYLAPGNLTLINSRVQHTGTASMADDGGLISATTGTLTINNSQVIGGKAADRGGNICYSGAMTLIISGEDALIADGTAANRGGNLYDTSSASTILMTDGEISNGTVTASGGVGANICISGTMVITGGYISTGNYGGYGRGISIFNTSATPATKLYIYGGRINGVLGANNTYVDPLVQLCGGEYTTDPTNYQTGNSATGADWVVNDCFELVKEGNLWKVIHKDNDTTVTVEGSCSTPGSKTTTCELCKTNFMGYTFGGTYEYQLAADHVEETVAGYDATCSAPGLTDGVVCSVCGEVLTAQEEIPTLAHTEETIAGSDATCSAPGLTDGVVCSVCGEVLTAQEEIPALAHTEETVAGTAATCTTTGLTDGVICSVCGEVLTAQEEIPTTDHTPGDTEIENATEGACTLGGTYDEVVYCSVCDEEISRVTVTTEATGHTEETVAGYAATCTTTGLTDGVVCSVCGEVLTAQEEIPTLAHTEETVAGYAATCTTTGLTDGVKCSVCEAVLTAQEEIPTLAHTEETVAGKAATCTETGLTDGVKCSVCEAVLTAQEEIPMTEHAWDSGVYTEPTTETDGFTTYTCGTCGATDVKTDAGSQLSDLEITGQPTAATAAAGTNATFTVAATGKGLTYQWQWAYADRNTWMNTALGGFDSATLTVPAYQARDGYRYRCYITDAQGNVVITTPATLEVTAPEGLVQPVDATAAVGATAIFTVGTEVDATSYQWQWAYANGTNWMNTGLTGNKTNTLNVPVLAGRNGYQYRCRVVMADGSAYITDAATLTVG